jgi:tetratricopeptide (TPR) repeat protein
MDQVADVLDMKDALDEAVQWLEGVNALVPNDARVLARLGSLHAKLGALPEALGYLQQAHRARPQDTGIDAELAQLQTSVQLEPQCI